MYVPKYYQVTDEKEIERFLKENAFATLISSNGEFPAATHIPLLCDSSNGDFRLVGHLAKANPHWKLFETNPNVLAIFQGPHAYISSSWYSHQNVSTWNYMSVHVYGSVRLLDEAKLREQLTLLTNKYETGREKPVFVESLPKDYIDSQLKAIVGFEIEVKEIQASYKLSQNRNEKDYEEIIRQLEKEGKAEGNEVAKEMRRIKK